jgi:cytochrome P450
LARLPLVDRILKESMRLYPPVWAFERAALAVDTIAGHAVRPGDLVLIAPWATHRCAHFWANPDHFDPDRFLPEAESERQKFAYFPFSAGARKCIGDGFAMLEARLILATLLQNCRLVRADKNPLIPEPLVTLRPRGALNMHVTLRPSETSDEAKARNSELAQPSR